MQNGEAGVFFDVATLQLRSDIIPYQDGYILPTELLERIAASGYDKLPELIWIEVNSSIQVERQQFLGAAPYQSTPERHDQANGFKPKTFKSQQGEITLDMLLTSA